MTKIWIDKIKTDYSIDYKLTSNSFVLSFEKEVIDLENKYQEHLFKVEESNSGLRYTLTFILNPKLCYKKGKRIFTKLLDKEIELREMPHSMTKYCFDRGYHLKTLKMNRDESLTQAIKYLQSFGLSGYVLFEDVLSRYTDPEFASFMESCGID